MIDAGGISYTVEVDTGNSIKAAEAADKAFDKLEKGLTDAAKAAGIYIDAAGRAREANGRFASAARQAELGMKGLGVQASKTADGVRRANRELSGATNAMSGLYRIMTAYIGLRTVQAVVAMSDQYGQMASRVRGATQSIAEYEMVQRRLLDTANRTYRPLAEAQEIFLQTQGALKILGYDMQEALDITDSLSLGFTRNATSSERAKVAMGAFSRSLAKGRVDADAWEMILISLPNIADDVAAATGRTSAEIRKLGAEGKLNLNALTEALRRTKEENGAMADAMETSVADAFTALRNSMQVFIGKVNESSEASGILTSAVGDMAETLQDPEVIRAAQELATGVVRWLNWLADSAKDVVGAVKWAADELAATMNGVASDDIVRLQDEASKIKQVLEGGVVNFGERLRFFGKNGIFEYWSDEELKAELAKIEQAIAAEQKAMEQRLTEQRKNNAPSGGAINPRDNQLVEARAAATERATRARRGLTDAEREAKRAAEEQARAEEQNANTIERLREAIYQATLSAEALAQRKAELSLNKFATPDEVETVKQLAAELYKLEEIENRRAAFTGRDGSGDVASQIRGNVSPLSGGKFDDQTARYEAEAAAEKQRYAEALERLKEAKELELEVKGGYQALEEQMYQEHIDRMNQIDQARTEMQLQEWAAGFDQMSNDIAEFAEVFASENKAMFQASKAAAIASTIIKTYESAQNAFTAMSSIPYVGPALGIAAAGAAIGAGMARVAKIRSQSMPGKALGGPVQAQQMYRVNENGPEIFNAANGRQYMIPNQRGDVVSNRDATRSAANDSNVERNVTVNQNITVSGKIDRYTATQLASQSAQKQRVSQARFGK